MKILAIDSSCDETSAAVLQNNRILSNIVASQVELHKKWGGVVPDIARRAHEGLIEPTIQEALKRAHTTMDKIDYFAATYGPGLAIALEIGLKKAQNLAKTHRKPFIPVDHMEGHLLSSFAKNARGKHPRGPQKSDLPAIGMLVSGGHTELILMEDFGKYTLLGETLDDAAGEAFDKLAKMLNLGYPGGPIISEFAEKKGKPGRFDLPIPMEKSCDLNFSYSGLKTACLYKIRDIDKQSRNKQQNSWVYDFCADFVNSVIQSIVLKLNAATDQYPTIRSVLLGGGVISNIQLRRAIRSAMRKKNIKVFQPYDKRLFTDNAGMIGISAYYQVKRNDPRISTGSKINQIDRNPTACFASLKPVQEEQ